jgi:hypothetical protein
MKPIRLPFWQFSRDDVCPTEHVLADGDHGREAAVALKRSLRIEKKNMLFIVQRPRLKARKKRLTKQQLSPQG